jgi:hypothetical protein
VRGVAGEARERKEGTIRCKALRRRRIGSFSEEQRDGEHRRVRHDAAMEMEMEMEKEKEKQKEQEKEEIGDGDGDGEVASIIDREREEDAEARKEEID